MFISLKFFSSCVLVFLSPFAFFSSPVSYLFCSVRLLLHHFLKMQMKEEKNQQQKYSYNADSRIYTNEYQENVEKRIHTISFHTWLESTRSSNFLQELYKSMWCSYIRVQITIDIAHWKKNWRVHKGEAQRQWEKTISRFIYIFSRFSCICVKAK